LIAVLAATGLIGWTLDSPYKYLLFLTLVPILVFVFILNSPKMSKSSRAAALDNELPFVVGYMSILASGGLSLVETLRRISEISIFRAGSYEAKRILIDIDVLGHDPITALDRASKYSPSKHFSELLAGYTTVLRTGGDFVNFLNLQLRESFNERAEQTKRTVETIGTVAESYLIVTVVLGITLFTLYLIETIIDQNPGAIANVYLF
jgi:flagellar protein FlaJ